MMGRKWTWLLGSVMALAVSEASAQSDPFEDAPEGVRVRFEVAPIDGLTTAWHPVPSRTDVPCGVVLRLRARMETSDGNGLAAPGDFRWRGAVEVQDDGEASTATCVLTAPGKHSIRVTYVSSDGVRITRKSRLNGVDVDPSDVLIRPIELSVDPIDLNPAHLNDSTMKHWFGGAVAGLEQVGESRWVTSVKNQVTLRAEISHPGFSPLVEWRIDGEVRGLGEEWLRLFHAPSVYRIAAGPPAKERRVELETYRVHLTSHQPDDAIPHGVPVTFEAVTEPPGFESAIQWISSTKYGTATPTLGTGPTFTTTFRNVIGPSGHVWLGVKGDHVGFGEDISNAKVPTMIYIPVVINLYAGSNTSKTEAKAIVDEANKVLAQAGIKLMAHDSRIKDPPTGEHGDANNDGDLDLSEYCDIAEYGDKEVRRLPCHTGLKLSFGDELLKDAAGPGQTILGAANGAGGKVGRPTILIRKQATAKDAGATLAHEVGHALGLNHRADIDDDTESDDDGHAPEGSGDDKSGNLMAQSWHRNGTHLTEKQICRLLLNRIWRGKCARQFTDSFPAEKDAIQGGAETDDDGDGGFVGAPWTDLVNVGLASHFSEANIEGEVALSGLLPEDQDLDLSYTFGFDADASTGTGISWGGVSGIDKIATVDATGRIDAGTFAVSAEILDVASGNVDPIGDPERHTRKILASDLDGMSHHDVFWLDLPEFLLDLAAPQVPVVVTAHEGGFLRDTALFVYDQERWLHEPTLITFGNGVPTPGAPYPIEIRDLTPNQTFRLILDEDEVLSGVLDASGDFSGSFIFPATESVSVPHFLHAEDPTGSFAALMTCPDRGK